MTARIRPPRALVLGTALLTVALACEPANTGKAPERPTEAVAPADAGAPAAPTAAAASRPEFCVPPDLRSAKLDAAWPEKESVVVCATAAAEDASAGHRACVRVDAAGVYREEAERVGSPLPKLPSEFDTASADGRWQFSLTGGARSPHGAIGVLRDAHDKRVLKRGPVAYDEHLAFLGWAGNDVVLQQSVDEGPGCTLGLYDPNTWPISTYLEGGILFADCYGGVYVVKPAPGVYAVVDARGGGVRFVDGLTLATTKLPTGRPPENESDPIVATWLENGTVLVQAYGPPWTGDVIRIDLNRRAILSVWSPGVSNQGGCTPGAR